MFDQCVIHQIIEKCISCICCYVCLHEVCRSNERSQLRRELEFGPFVFSRWIPHVDGTKFRRESSPLARVDCEVTKGSANRWMTFAKNPSPDPVRKMNPESKASTLERSKKDEGPCKDPDNSKWQPPRKFSPAKSEKGHLQRQSERLTMAFPFSSSTLVRFFAI